MMSWRFQRLKIVPPRVTPNACEKSLLLLRRRASRLSNFHNLETFQPANLPTFHSPVPHWPLKTDNSPCAARGDFCTPVHRFAQVFDQNLIDAENEKDYLARQIEPGSLRTLRISLEGAAT